MNRFCQCVLLVLIPTGFVPCEAAEPQPLFRWSRAIDTSSVGQEEILALPLNSEIYDKTQSSLNDLAIQNANGGSVPFLIRKQKKTLTQVSNEHPYDVRKKMITSFPEEGQTGIEIQTKGEPLTSFRISTSSKNFQRAATLYEVSRTGSRVTHRPLASTQLRRFDFRELNEERLTFRFPENRHRHFRIVIDNHDSQPVEINGIKAFGQLEELVFFAEQNQKYNLLYGDKDAEKVQLDTAALQAALGKKIQPILVSMGVPQERDLSNLPPRTTDFRDYINNPFLIAAVVFIMIAVLARFLYSAAQQIDSASDDESSVST